MLRLRTLALQRPLARFASSSSSLVSTLKAELKNELDNKEPTDFIQKFKQQGVWDISDSPGSKEVTLTRSYNKEEIRLIFSTDGLDNEIDFDENEEETESDDYDGAVPVQMIVTKPDHDGSLEIALTASSQGAFVDNVNYFPHKLVVDETSEGDWQRRGLYGSPKFEDLDEELIENFQSYIEKRGIDTELSNFIQEYLTHKEQQEYVQWLKNVQSFVSK